MATSSLCLFFRLRVLVVWVVFQFREVTDCMVNLLFGWSVVIPRVPEVPVEGVWV